MDVNPPPNPNPKADKPAASFVAYVWRGDKFDDIGLAKTHPVGHLLRLHLGVEKSDVVELRGLKDVFYPGHQVTNGDPKPTFLAFLAGSDIRAGTAWLHEDGKGHRLKLRQSIPDNIEIELRDAGNFSAESSSGFTRKKSPFSNLILKGSKNEQRPAVSRLTFAGSTFEATSVAAIAFQLYRIYRFIAVQDPWQAH